MEDDLLIFATLIQLEFRNFDYNVLKYKTQKNRRLISDHEFEIYKH